MIAKPEDRRTTVGPLLEQAGGKLHGLWYAFGEYDVLALVELPDNVTAAAVITTVRGERRLQRRRDDRAPHRGGDGRGAQEGRQRRLPPAGSASASLGQTALPSRALTGGHRRALRGRPARSRRRRSPTLGGVPAVPPHGTGPGRAGLTRSATAFARDRANSAATARRLRRSREPKPSAVSGSRHESTVAGGGWQTSPMLRRPAGTAGDSSSGRRSP